MSIFLIQTRVWSALQKSNFRKNGYFETNFDEGRINVYEWHKNSWCIGSYLIQIPLKPNFENIHRLKNIEFPAIFESQEDNSIFYFKEDHIFNSSIALWINKETSQEKIIKMIDEEMERIESIFSKNWDATDKPLLFQNQHRNMKYLLHSFFMKHFDWQKNWYDMNEIEIDLVIFTNTVKKVFLKLDNISYEIDFDIDFDIKNCIKVKESSWKEYLKCRIEVFEELKFKIIRKKWNGEKFENIEEDFYSLL